MPLFYLTPLARIVFFDPKKNCKKNDKKINQKKRDIIITPLHFSTTVAEAKAHLQPKSLTFCHEEYTNIFRWD